MQWWIEFNVYHLSHILIYILFEAHLYGFLWKYGIYSVFRTICVKFVIECEFRKLIYPWTHNEASFVTHHFNMTKWHTYQHIVWDLENIVVFRIVTHTIKSAQKVIKLCYILYMSKANMFILYKNGTDFIHLGLAMHISLIIHLSISLLGILWKTAVSILRNPVRSCVIHFIHCLR